MSRSLKSFATGIVSGALTCAASIYALAHASAFVMPRGFPVALWIAVVVFGLGATSVAFLIHFVAIRILAANDLPAFIGFALTVAVVLAVTGLPANDGNPIASWLVGASLASLVRSLLGSNQSLGYFRIVPAAWWTS